MTERADERELRGRLERILAGVVEDYTTAPAALDQIMIEVRPALERLEAENTRLRNALGNVQWMTGGSVDREQMRSIRDYVTDTLDPPTPAPAGQQGGSDGE